MYSKNRKEERLLEGWIGEDGYEYVTLIGRDGVASDERVDMLVAKAFPDMVEGEYAEGKTLCHKDGNKTNNRADNLKWI